MAAAETPVSLFQSHPQLRCDSSDCSARCSSASATPSTPNASLSSGAWHKPRALTAVTSPASSTTTTFVNTTYRGRFPCGRYHRARIIHTTLRASLPVTPDRSDIDEAGSRFVAPLRRMLSSRKQEERKVPLKPLLLPRRLGLEDAVAPSVCYATTEALPNQKHKNEGRRLSLVAVAGWLPYSIANPLSTTIVSPSTPDPTPHLKPLILARRNSEPIPATGSGPTSESDEVPQAERTNMLAWLLDCIQRDMMPHWSVDAESLADEPVSEMLLQNGQPRCIVVRAKRRRSALF